MALPDQLIVLLGRTLSGHHHDDSRLQQAFPPELDWFPASHIRVAFGSLGMPSDSHGDQRDIPTTKPRQSKKPPNPQGSDAPQAAKQVWSPLRIFLEPAMGGMKRSNMLVHVFRNRKADFEDDAIGIGAGLWNLVLSY